MTTENKVKADGIVNANARKVKNLMALAFTSYKEGDPDTAFDLFVEGMETVLVAEEASLSPDNFSSMIEEALTEAAQGLEDPSAEEVIEEISSSNSEDDLLVEDDFLSLAAEVSDTEDERLDDEARDRILRANIECI